MPNDFNDQIIAEFRGNHGKVGGMFDPQFAEYQAKTTRKVPVVALERLG
ncbi:hypothetical protein BH23ACT12_BH23ACT12_09100 [soil metagenome]